MPARPMGAKLAITTVLVISSGYLFNAVRAHAATFNFQVSGGCSEACSATAAITPGSGVLDVVLTDTQANPRSAGDLLSSIEISPTGSLGTPTLSSQSGQLINVTSNTGPYSTSTGPPTHWGVGTSGGSGPDTLVPGTPTSVSPLPSALPLFASGLGALGLLLAWRRKRKSRVSLLGAA